MPLLGIMLDCSYFHTFCHPQKSQMGRRFACGSCPVHLAAGKRIFVLHCQLGLKTTVLCIKAKILSSSSNKMIHDVKPNELLKWLRVWRWLIRWWIDFHQVLFLYWFMMLDFGQPLSFKLNYNGFTDLVRRFKSIIGNDVKSSFQHKMSL